MAKRVVIEGTPSESPTLINNESQPIQEVEKKSEIDFNAEEGIASFKLEDGTPVVMKSPKTRQFLLLESFMKSTEAEYKTESFIAVKLASLCITKFGNKDKVTFDELLDELEITDLERVAEAIMCFQDKLEALRG
ncbi:MULTISPECIES: hypothetical protein [Calothrix]|uniref:Phage tail assembly protein n=2 Tax=Calothrix TaxID=1186 RepID=A0ABR8A9Y1_9CYAN|nr:MULTISPECIES: hypothetical protein [Calothrix]MBD2196614.1 hypothetical protein [Calothrix parietina FACHB-288]MBD2228021.1 hypothetical protein [Calothrix anomala FACHB-343]